MRVVLDKTCENCGSTFETTYTTKKYCCRKCLTHKHRLRNPIRCLLHGAKCRAKSRGIEYALTEKDFDDVPSVCPVLGIPLIINVGSGLHPNSPSLDRIDPSNGYVKNNVRIISARANHLKSNATIEELEKVLDDSRNLRSRSERTG